jgi:hypothetical protein
MVENGMSWIEYWEQKFVIRLHDDTALYLCHLITLLYAYVVIHTFYTVGMC